MKIGELITQYRTTHVLSQRQFASACGLSNGYISMLERGVNPSTQKPVTPTIPQLKKLADGMHMTVMELLEKVDDMPVDVSGAVAGTLTSGSSQLSLFDQEPFLNPDERDLIRKYRCLDARGKSAVLNVLNHEYESLPGDKTNSTPRQA